MSDDCPDCANLDLYKDGICTKHQEEFRRLRLKTPQPTTTAGGRMTGCSECKKGVLELIEGQCESCFRKLKIVPLVELRAQTLKEVERINGLLTAKLEKLAKSSRHNLNLSFTCVCGVKFKLGLEFIAHLPDCGGPAKSSNRNGFHAKLMKSEVDWEDLG